MGKPAGKKKDHEVPAPAPKANGHHHPTKSWEEKRSASSSSSSKMLDEDTAMFINMSHELREEGNRLFQKKDHEGAMLKYEKALKLLPRNHIDVAHLHTSMAVCYMQLGLGEYPRAISECNMALQVSPRYTKALLKRAKCYEALNRLDLAMRDVRVVLNLEPNNSTALEVLDSLRETMEEKGIVIDETEIALAALKQQPEPPVARLRKVVREKMKKNKKEAKGEDEGKAKKVIVEEKVKVENLKKKEKEKEKLGKEEKGKLGKEEKGKLVKEEKGKLGKDDKEKSGKEEKEKLGKDEKGVVTRTVKLIYGEDIRWAQLPVNCGIRLVRDVIRDRFPGLKGVLVKYKDREGDLVTITNTAELRLAETCHVLGSIRLYVTKVEPEEEPFYDDGLVGDGGKVKVAENGNGGVGKGVNSTVEDWLVQFARLFKNHVGFDSDAYLDIHGIGMKLYSEAMEDAVTSEAAQELFNIAGNMFQEMAALALFNWGSVHMSRARKRVSYPEDGSRDSSFECLQVAYEWAQKEYMNAEKRFGEAVKIKPDFYEGFLALGHQQFEQARLCWCYLIATEKDLEAGHSDEVLQLYNKAEDSMERGMLMWEEIEERRLNGLSKSDKYKEQLEKMGLHGLFRDVSPDEADEQAARMRLQIYLLWGTMLYERSVVEYKLGLPTWEECVEVAIEKFELAGASSTDIGVMIKNHCSNETAMEGFKIDEIVQAWNEMYDGWQFDVPSFRLEPLFRRRVPKLHYILEQF
ncbi:unnamed protein product [Sphenostylis stenocarpa]|uniref:PB1 domain-containing protein n=1 Tax=Sphenostylis stenocarpa TaxID=92480 RepID=A0AA86T0I7_9FABA|nr:unnamed protein product [Sphenostylis stenocarpa]